MTASLMCTWLGLNLYYTGSNWTLPGYLRWPKALCECRFLFHTNCAGLKKNIQTTRQSSLLKNYTPASDSDIQKIFDQTLRENPHWDITIWCPITDGAFMHQILARQLTLHHNATSASFHFIGHRMRLEHFRHKPFDQPQRIFNCYVLPADSSEFG